jgi:hypothetical protein
MAAQPPRNQLDFRNNGHTKAMAGEFSAEGCGLLRGTDTREEAMTQTERFEILVVGSGTGGKLMAVVQTAMLAGMPYSTLRDAVFAHPTMAEGLGFLLSNVPARSAQPVTPQSALPAA